MGSRFPPCYGLATCWIKLNLGPNPDWTLAKSQTVASKTISWWRHVIACLKLSRVWPAKEGDHLVWSWSMFFGDHDHGSSPMTFSLSTSRVWWFMVEKVVAFVWATRACCIWCRFHALLLSLALCDHDRCFFVITTLAALLWLIASLLHGPGGSWWRRLLPLSGPLEHVVFGADFTRFHSP